MRKIIWVLPILDVFYPLLEKGDEVIVIDPVENFFAIAAGLDDLHLAQASQLVRDRRFGDADDFRQRTDIELIVRQNRQDAHPAGIAEGAKQLGDVRGSMFIKELRGDIHGCNL